MSPLRASTLGNSSTVPPSPSRVSLNLEDVVMPPSRVPNMGDYTAAMLKDPPLSGWSSLFASAYVRLQFVALVMKDGNKLVTISKSIYDQGSSFWDDCLLDQFFSPPPKIVVIQSFVGKLWGRNGRVEVIPLEDEGFFSNFLILLQ